MNLSRRDLDSNVVNIELTLASIIQGVALYFLTENARTAFRAMRDINSGLVYINAGTTGAEPHLPFGGTKQSGNGHRELGRKAVEEFTTIDRIDGPPLTPPT